MKTLLFILFTTFVFNASAQVPVRYPGDQLPPDAFPPPPPPVPPVTPSVPVKPAPPVVTQPRVKELIQVLSATYGGNCGAQDGNVPMWPLLVACNTYDFCAQAIEPAYLGSAAGFRPDCQNDFLIRYRCTSDVVERQAYLPDLKTTLGVVYLTCKTPNPQIFYKDPLYFR